MLTPLLPIAEEDAAKLVAVRDDAEGVDLAHLGRVIRSEKRRLVLVVELGAVAVLARPARSEGEEAVSAATSRPACSLCQNSRLT